MVLTIEAELEAALHKAADRRGVDPASLALEALKERFVSASEPLQPQDEWERRLLDLAEDCGVAIPDNALRREALYD